MNAPGLVVDGLTVNLHDSTSHICCELPDARSRNSVRSRSFWVRSAASPLRPVRLDRTTDVGVKSGRAGFPVLFTPLDLFLDKFVVLIEFRDVEDLAHLDLARLQRNTLGALNCLVARRR